MTADERRAGPPTGHADLDTLADLHAGVLDGAEAGRVRAHAAGCPRCSATLAALDAVQGELRSLPAPALPAAVAARLDATLADLRATHRPDATTPGATPAGTAAAATPADGTTPADGATPADGRRPTLAAAASHTTPMDHTADGGTTDDRTTGDRTTDDGITAGGRRGGGRSEADEVDEVELARVRRARRLSRSLGAIAAAVAVIAAGGAVTAIVRAGTGTSTSDSASSGAGSAASAPIPAEAARPTTQQDSASGERSLPTYDRESLRAALPAIAAGGPSVTSGDTGRETACARGIAGTTGSLRGVEHITYLGRPAYVYVYADGDRLTGYVVTEDCGRAAGLPATVVDTVS